MSRTNDKRHPHNNQIVSVQIDGEQRKAIDQICSATGLSISNVIRSMIDDRIAAYIAKRNDVISSVCINMMESKYSGN